MTSQENFSYKSSGGSFRFRLRGGTPLVLFIAAGAVGGLRRTRSRLVAGKIHLTVGSVYAGLGETERAEHHLRTAKSLFEAQVGPSDIRTLEVNHALGVLLRVNRAAYEESETLIRHAFNRRQRTLGPKHRDTLAAMIELAQVRMDREAHDEAEALFNTAVRQAGLAYGSDDPLTLGAREGIIATLWDRGDREQATELKLVKASPLRCRATTPM